LLEFRNNGIEVSIDDFGTGFSSLSYLKAFDIDYLKIDRSFISNLTNNTTDHALVEAIIVMAHKLDIKTIAEGVETQEQQDLLIELGCDYVQGYFYSHPIPAEEFEKLINQQREGYSNS
jgi:EAL domain-containing protein (putative c-di-GMP-specific phosphodiesterase class I)